MIRRRLTAVVVALVAVLGGLAVIAAVHTLEDRLVDDIDQQLAAVPEAIDRASGEELRRQLAPGLEDGRRVAVVRVGPDGAIVTSVPSGAPEAPDPLPDVTGLTAPQGPFTLSGQDGGPRYRAVTSTLPNGGVLVTGISMADVDAAVTDARQVLFGVGLIALAVIALGGVAGHPARAATPRPHGGHGHPHRRGPHHRAGPRPVAHQRDRPARHGAQPDARPHRRRPRRPHVVGAADAAVRGRRLPRAADPAHGDPRLRRAVGPVR